VIQMTTWYRSTFFLGFRSESDDQLVQKYHLLGFIISFHKRLRRPGGTQVPLFGFQGVHLTGLKLDTLKSDKSSKGRVSAATDALFYNENAFLIQNKWSMRRECLIPEDVRFEDCQP
jgi:hypothetical protein